MSDVSPRFFVLTDLLLGAVYADERLEGEEEEAVRSYLLEIIGGEELPIELEARIANFDPEAFDLEASASEFEADPATDRRTPSSSSPPSSTRTARSTSPRTTTSAASPTRSGSSRRSTTTS